MNIHYKHQFKGVLLSGVKKHTIRMKKFNEGTVLSHIIFPYRPYRECVMTNICKSTQMIHIDGLNQKVSIDNKEIAGDMITTLAHNDGFSNLEEFWKFFKKGADGYIIHWTDLRY